MQAPQKVDKPLSWEEEAAAMAVDYQQLARSGAPLQGQLCGPWRGEGRNRGVPATAGAWTVPTSYAADHDQGVAQGSGSWKGGSSGMGRR